MTEEKFYLSNAVTLKGKSAVKEILRAGKFVFLVLEDSEGRTQELILDYQGLICMAEDVSPGRAVDIGVYESNGEYLEVQRKMKSYTVGRILTELRQGDYDVK